jgi:2,5-diamino-6-(ribosylamino)-4(3H)-pyrimidinone 5'-phosphate reductase
MMTNPSSCPGNAGARLRPLVILNFAVTADGKVSTNRYTPTHFTSTHDKQRLLEIRALADAILVGRNTLETDQMAIDLPNERLRQRRREEGKSESPLRVILSRSGNISTASRVFERGNAPILIYSTDRMASSQRTRLTERATVHLSGSGELDILWVLSHLYEHYRVRSLICEGGPTLAKTLAQADVIDEIYLTIAAKIFGGSAAPGLTGLPGEFLPGSRHFELIDIDRGDNECYLRYRRKP